MSDIPSARQSIMELVTALLEGEKFSNSKLADELMAIEAMLYRKAPVRRASVNSQKMTPELAKSIRVFAARNEDMPLQQIAQKFGVNSGRVSEVLHGERW